MPETGKRITSGQELAGEYFAANLPTFAARALHGGYSAGDGAQRSICGEVVAGEIDRGAGQSGGRRSGWSRRIILLVKLGGSCLGVALLRTSTRSKGSRMW